ncbi:MAG: Radical SAM superfamily protein [Planctomycetes bacterium ADurb.Bin126]|nr:MAG: Radical SAM superfamily protein [Planctomycetes bacterium ADurb.Bin126]
MELPSRRPGDRLLAPGEHLDVRRRLRLLAARHDLLTVVVNAFDHRTRILPFANSSVRIAPAGPRAIGSALADSGFTRTRIVLQQWNPRFDPTRMNLDGQMPDLLLVSSMRIHAAAFTKLLRDACRIEPSRRPLIVTGGPLLIYEPWMAFGDGSPDAGQADLAVTGEDYVLLSLLEVLLSERGENESLRSAFLRARDRGLLDAVPGLVYPRTDRDGTIQELVDTGVQRLLGDLDELPSPLLGYRLLERPSRKATLSGQAMDPRGVRRSTPASSVLFTLGCKFSCPYCPIPAYNQRTFRAKSGQRIAEELTGLAREYRFPFYFGTDDNFFNEPERALDIVEELAGATIDGELLRKRVRWGTEATVHDTLRMKDHLQLVRKAGVRAIWLGVEDVTATLVRKGQGGDKSLEAMRLLNQEGIMPIPMLMHHEGQPLLTRGSDYGLLNQLHILRKAGAVDAQVLVITPATGSRGYESVYESGQAIAAAGGKTVEPHMQDGNYVVALRAQRPWQMQVNLILAMLFFSNPLRLLIALARPKSARYLVDAGLQFLTMVGMLRTLPRLMAWALRLAWQDIRRHRRAPGSSYPLRQATPPDSTGEPAAGRRGILRELQGAESGLPL